jgi:hypothetical protein
VGHDAHFAIICFDPLGARPKMVAATAAVAVLDRVTEPLEQWPNCAPAYPIAPRLFLPPGSDLAHAEP